MAQTRIARERLIRGLLTNTTKAPIIVVLLVFILIFIFPTSVNHSSVSQPLIPFIYVSYTRALIPSRTRGDA